MSAYSDGVALLARRELSIAALRTRLLDREHPVHEVEQAIERLIENGSLNDRRVAVTYANTAARVKGRGRLRVARELQQMGIAKEVAADALGEVFGALDERALIAAAIRKKLRGRTKVETRTEQARLYQFLLRQGFTPTGVATAMKRAGGVRAPDEDISAS